MMEVQFPLVYVPLESSIQLWSACKVVVSLVNIPSGVYLGLLWKVYIFRGTLVFVSTMLPSIQYLVVIVRWGTGVLRSGDRAVP